MFGLLLEAIAFFVRLKFRIEEWKQQVELEAEMLPPLPGEWWSHSLVALPEWSANTWGVSWVNTWENTWSMK